MRTHCCPELAGTTQTLHRDTPPDTGRVIAYDAVFDEYRLVEHPGCLGRDPLRYCPWCGTALPPSQRGSWFETVARHGYTPDDPNLPERFITSQWRDTPGP